MDSVQHLAGQTILIADVIAHPLSQTLPKPTITSWGTYHKVSMVLVEVRTDAGIVGVGEVLARFSPKAYAELIETSLKPRLIGQDARNIGALWQSMRRSLSGRAGGMLIEAIAGVDIALWDIMGKAAGMPIAKLLGGIGQETINVYAAAVNWVDDAEADRELERYIGEGFPRIKVKIANSVKDACRRIERLRKRAGDDIELCVDANWAYDLDQAIEVGRALSANGYFWFEEPLAPENEQGYEELRKRCDVPLAAGESNFTTDQAQRLVANRTLSILQPDVARAGGISETRRMADYAALHDVGYAPHIGMSGIICETASAHLAAALPNFRVMECECDLSPFKRDLADLAPGCLRQKNGQLDVPTRPGLGIEIDWGAVKRLRIQ
ncbi:mandelate racemase/muconate lactonizing enzyme family protein [Rhizobium leguminosarum]|jgi:galactonate dehydratase|uniref:Mandelate racemase/muconate lactonizing enzyme family protein n=2 Tax=Rhizobium TaxID=379 RepID=A0A444HIG5_RHILE|nr:MULTISPECIES: mandelate racemase/muconate lactonizing enzyme family protein [Rhizobium]MBY5454733.1 mandelate racemase/muconate lactonizing enzyme family protein [Rhizobium leguminosarum]NKL62593.1 mandelate racemase/muconate lactonizing enzyme family protein [Rhizobium leguminosarum bv. viciae]RWX18052.1 mandelate racemase/muconate lactonizing enzyme family protein [Rhizobium leguminosarum]RWX21219.1 mandelate racemase/muconate lactonizing enzyme family protein [Rhizobium leguminosarum]TAU